MAVLVIYDGTCVACGEEIVAGVDDIELEDDEWVHFDCTTEPVHLKEGGELDIDFR